MSAREQPMQASFRVDPATGWGEVTVSGEVVVEGLLRLLQSAWSDPTYASVERALWNFSEAWTQMRTEDLMQLLPWMSANKQGRGAKTIAIVAVDDVVFGVGRMFNSLQPDWTINLFRDEAQARAWLGAQAPG